MRRFAARLEQVGRFRVNKDSVYSKICTSYAPSCVRAIWKAMRPVFLRSLAPGVRPGKAHYARVPSCTRVKCAASYDERLISAADASDAVTALEVLTEVRS